VVVQIYECECGKFQCIRKEPPPACICCEVCGTVPSIDLIYIKPIPHNFSRCITCNQTEEELAKK